MCFNNNIYLFINKDIELLIHNYRLTTITLTKNIKNNSNNFYFISYI